MKVNKLNESTFEKLENATTVVNPVMGDAIKSHKLKKDEFEKILKERGYGKQFIGANKQETPKGIEQPKVNLEESLFEGTGTLTNVSDNADIDPDIWEDDPEHYDLIVNKITGEKKSKPMDANQSWLDLGNDGREKYDFWDKIWAELVQDVSFSSEETKDKLREVDPKNKKIRYKEANIDSDGNIIINTKTEEDLAFARKVANHYGLKTFVNHTKRKVSNPWSIKIIVPEERPNVDDADNITDKVLAEV